MYEHEIQFPQRVIYGIPRPIKRAVRRLSALRSFLAKKLGGKNGRLWEIQKQRKDSITVESEDAKDLLKSFAQNFARNTELLKLLEQTLNLDHAT